MVSSDGRQKLARNCETPLGFETAHVVDTWEGLIGKVVTG